MGRPRKLSEEEAVERALQVFWRKGYDLASVADLTAALQVGPSGLYNAFGSKEGLYRLAIERYVERYASFVETAAEADLDVLPAVQGLLREAVKAYTDPTMPSGCAIMQSAGAARPEDSVAAAITLEVKGAVERRIQRMLERASKSHGTPLSASSRVLAKYLIGVLRGLSQLAIDGAGRADLMRVADVAARSCPGEVSG
ncbi:MAG: TetR/AcrR family transcriptional regulator [Myxococcales bacterium]|nr:TetR/AcrR family transcriptional regulator [Myxococcales bacterium]MDD9969703.1 TetR/AcrR family transcriptional regulator [Myxococcales bacterium]